MSTTRSAKDKVTGLFTVKCFDYSGCLVYQEDFANVQDADKAAAIAERRMMFASIAFPQAINDMSDDELLAALNS